jgi:hypothetical protein
MKKITLVTIAICMAINIYADCSSFEDLSENWLKSTAGANTAPITDDDEEGATETPRTPAPIGNAPGWMLALCLSYFAYTVIRKRQKTSE